MAFSQNDIDKRIISMKENISSLLVTLKDLKDDEAFEEFYIETYIKTINH